jgi:hypothetical protein
MSQRFLNFFFSTIFLLGFHFLIHAQKFEKVFTHTFGAFSFHGVYDVIVDEGYVYMAGSYRDTLHVDTLGISTLNNGSNGYLAKLDTNGNLIWLKTFDGAPVSSLALDTNKNLFVLGTFSDSVFFDSTHYLSELTLLNEELYLLKLDSNANFQWAKQVVQTASFQAQKPGGGMFVGLPKRIVIAKNQSLQLLTSYSGSISYNTVPVGSSNNSSSVLYNIDNSNGNLNWSRIMGDNSNLSIVRPSDLVVDHLGNTIITGSYTNRLNAGASTVTGSQSYDRIYIVKYDPAGNLLWLRSTANTSKSFSQSRSFRLAVDNQANVYLSGTYNVELAYDTISRDVLASGLGNWQPFILKMAPNGNAISIKAIENTSIANNWIYFHEIAIDKEKSLYLSGNYRLRFEIDSNVISRNASYTTNSIFVKLDSNFQTAWATHSPGSDHNVGFGIALNDNKQPYFFGDFRGDISFGLRTFNKPLGSYITKLGECSTLFNNSIVDLCQGDTLNLGNQIITQSGVYKDTLISFNGCDSVVNLTVSVVLPTDSLFQVVSCSPYFWVTANTIYDSSGIYYKTLLNRVGCDSVLTLDLTINQNFGTEQIVSCDSLQWTNGITYYTSTNTPRDTFQNRFGCDSIIQLNLTINNSHNVLDSLSGCDSLTWIDGITYYSSTNQPIYVLSNRNGCDSIVNLNLIMNNSTFSTDQRIACDSLTWINGITYTSSTNSPVFNLPNAIGCDSIVNLNLTVNYSSSFNDQVFVCDSLSWIDNITYYSSTNSPTYTVTNFVGCDSVIRLNLTVNQFNEQLAVSDDTLFSNQLLGSSYQWLNCDSSYRPISGATMNYFIPNISGNYGCEVINSSCQDTTACFNILITGLRSLNKTKIEIFPNPTTDQVIMKNLEASSRIAIYNINGKLMRAIPVLNSRNLELDVSMWSKGLYFVEVESLGSNYTMKLIVQ